MKYMILNNRALLKLIQLVYKADSTIQLNLCYRQLWYETPELIKSLAKSCEVVPMERFQWDCPDVFTVRIRLSLLHTFFLFLFLFLPPAKGFIPIHIFLGLLLGDVSNEKPLSWTPVCWLFSSLILLGFMHSPTLTSHRTGPPMYSAQNFLQYFRVLHC